MLPELEEGCPVHALYPSCHKARVSGEEIVKVNGGG